MLQFVKRPLRGLRQYLAPESSLKMMRIAFNFILKALLFLRYLNFCPVIFGDIGKRPFKKAKVNFKTYFQNVLT